MKSKFNWGHGIFIVLTMFILFILTIVYKTLVQPEYDHKLVSEQYYNDEIHFQQEIDQTKNASALIKNVKLMKSEKGIHIVFPDIFEAEKIKGVVDLQRANDSKLDLSAPIKLDSLQMIIPSDQLKKGM